MPLKILVLPCFFKPGKCCDFIEKAAGLIQGDKDKAEVKVLRREIDEEVRQLKIWPQSDDGWKRVLDDIKCTVKIQMEIDTKKNITIYGHKDNHAAPPLSQITISYFEILNQHFDKKPTKQNDNSWNGKQWIESSRKRYDTSSATSLLVLLRDKIVHSRDMPSQFKKALGFFNDDGDLKKSAYIEFVHRRFPNLLSFLWLKFYKNYSKRSLKDFYINLDNSEYMHTLPFRAIRADQIAKSLNFAINKLQNQDKQKEDGLPKPTCPSMICIDLPVDLIQQRLDGSSSMTIHIFQNGVSTSWYGAPSGSVDPQIQATMNYGCTVSVGGTIVVIANRMYDLINHLETSVKTKNADRIVICTPKNGLEMTGSTGLSLLALALAEGEKKLAFRSLMELIAKELISRHMQTPATGMKTIVENDCEEHTMGVESYLETDEGRELLKKVTEHLTMDAYKKLFEDAKSGLKLVRDTIPKQTGYYVSRTLLKRVHLNPSIFTATCNDIFVFKNINPSELSKLIKSQEYVPSGSLIFGKRLDHKSCRFILLDEPVDWEEISRHLVQGANIPAHLIKFDQHTGTCILEETTGGSDTLFHFVTRKQGALGKDKSNAFVIPEAEFLRKNPEYEQPFAGYCICDSPGMGKTTLLASLARQAKNLLPHHIVAFIRLSSFTEKMEPGQVGQENSSFPSSVETVLEHLATCEEAKLILKELFAKEVLHMNLFLDSLDEVPLKQVPATLQFLAGLSTEYPHIKIYVASRPHLRKELESKLGVVSYDILPFSHSNKKDYLVAVWKQMNIEGDASKLEDFADVCLKEYERRCTYDEREITGIPLQCKLVAEVSANMARRHALSKNNLAPRDSCKFDRTLGQLYKDFMEQSFQKVFLGKEIDDCNKMQVVKNYHIWIAVDTLFPEIAKEFTNHFEFENIGTEIFLPGLLETRLSGRGESVELVHRTFAEYLTAEFFANALIGQMEFRKTNAGTQRFRMEVVQFFVKHFLVDLNYMRRGDYSVLFYFLNFILPDNENFSHYDLGLVSSALFAVEEYKLTYLMKNFDFSEFRNILSLITNSCPKLWCSTNETEVVSLETNLPLNKELNLYKALIRADVTGVKSIVDDSVDSGEWKRLLSVCVFKSCGNGLQEVERRKEICHLLLKAKSSEKIACEEEHFEGIHPLLTKLLIARGVSPFSPAWRDNALYDAVAHLSTSDLHDMCSFLIQNSRQVFFVERPEWRSAMHHILLNRNDIKTDTIEGILNISEIRDSAEHSQYINSLLLTALARKQSKEIVKTLVKHHPQSCKLLEKVESSTNCVDMLPLLSIDSSPVDAYGNNFLHICSKGYYSPEDYHKVVRFLGCNLSDKSILTERNAELELPVHLAVKHMELKKETLELFQTSGVSLDSVDRKGFSLLMCAITTKRSISCIQSLIEIGVDVNIQDRIGYTFICFVTPPSVVNMYCCDKLSAKEFHELIEMLLKTCGLDKLKKMIQLNYRSPETFLCAAINYMELSPETVHLLVKNGLGSWSAATDQDDSVLQCAIEGKRSLELVKYLVEQGADWNAKLRRCHANLAMLCAGVGCIELLRYFVSLGCDVNERNENGDNALQRAVRWYEINYVKDLLQIVNFLVESGADKANVNKEGQTAYDLALQEGITDRRILCAIE